ncbi:uncharacterized protein LOC128679757 [Plodia interpunctella]|uniref:uncharacterized protein LOC128679757 n=1 Tax=Plodia interpunctella TaxID=58824 RepID=UPI00236783C4|nr:uncharacterized protein LOC128679757 [Plodia interpunctella]
MNLQLGFLINFGIFSFVACQKYIEYPHYPCTVGKVVENECNYCICNNKFVFECYDKLHCHVSEQPERNQDEQQCQPRVVYVREDVVCICNKRGRWPHAKCDKAFQSFNQNNTAIQRCEPNSYVKVDCNMCRCDSNGQIDKEYCTKNNCTEIHVKTARKSLSLPQSVHGHCEPSNWYSLAPCQFCFCINTNKLVCNTADFYVNKLQLGKYNLNVCGKELIKEAIELIPTDSLDNSLRGNNDKKVFTTTFLPPVTRLSTKATTKSNGVNNLPMVVREVITHKKVDELDGSTEYYDDEGKLDTPKTNLAITEVKPETVDNIIEKESTIMGDNKNVEYEEEDNENFDSRSSKYANVKPNTANPAINVDQIIINVDKPLNKTQHQKLTGDRKTKDNYVLDVFVPNVLESLFNMQMRKSMVKVDVDSDCFPGTKETVGCNTCFCLNNGKKLCTDKVCQ